MRKCVRGKIAGILAAVLLGTVIVPGNVSATGSITESSDTLQNVKGVGDNNGADDTEPENFQGVEEDNNQQQTTQNGENTKESVVNQQNEDTEESEKINQDNSTIVNQGLINYVGVGLQYLKTPEEQQIVVSYGNGTENVTEAKLVCERADGNILEIGLTEKKNELFSFEHVFEEKDTGIYRVSQFSYVQDGVESSIGFVEIGIEAVFGVNEQHPNSQVAMEKQVDINEAELEASIVTVDMNSLENAESSIEDAIEETVEILEMKDGISRKSKNNSSRTKDSVADIPMSASAAKANNDVVVVLDPGHGGTDGGAGANGLLEKDLNLRIAQACKSELEEYNGVTVYMTRDSDVYVGLEERVRRAKAWGADIFVSLHMNSATTTSANGVEVYYPNKNYNPDIHNQGAVLASKIEQQLRSLGLYDRGIKQDPSQTSVKYPDGSTADGYVVIRESKENGFPGIIVEHAFLTNSSDAAKLKDNNFVRQLGIADATGIANYFNLTKGVSVKIKKKNDFTGTAQIDVAGLGKNAKIRIWNKDSKKSKEYSVASGKGILEFKVSDFGNERGEYCLEAQNSSDKVLYSDSFSVSNPNSKIDIQLDKAEKQYKVDIKISDLPSEVKEIQVPVWCADDQSDLKWYKATQVSTGNWQATINIKDFKSAGNYKVHVYANLQDGIAHFLWGTSFEVKKPTLKMKIENYQAGVGTFDVIISDVVSPSGIEKIEVPVWCADNQNDIKWYIAEKQSDGRTYKTTVNMSNHKYAVGVYKVHTYITAGNGIVAFGGGASQNVKLPDMEISITDAKLTETSYTLKISNVGKLGAVKGIQFGVWSDEGGQDDLVWYNGKNSSGDWSATAEIKKHKTAGRYQVHVYGTLSNGNVRFLGAKTFEVTKPTLSVAIENFQEKKGTFDVRIWNVKSPSGVKKIQVPVWCAANQSDIKWYDAVKQTDGTYKTTVSMVNHKYAVGEYKVHTYITAGNEVTVFGGGSSQKVILPDTEINITDVNATETKYKLELSNVESLGVIKNVQFGVWSDEGGQDDLKWYNGIRNVAGDWAATAEIRNHKTVGKYQVHVYATFSNGVTRFLGAKSFEVTRPTLSVTVENNQPENGTFDVILSNIKSSSGVDKIQVPVWCAENQSDIKWYDAQKQSNDTYKVTVNISNHKYATGVYKIHTYITAGNGINVFGGGISQQVALPKVAVTAVDIDGTEMKYALKISNLNFLGAIKNVQFATWSNEGGQDDLKWYNGNRNVAGDWGTTVEIKNHKTAGLYSVHVYVTLSNGIIKFVGSTSFNVTRPSVSGIQIENIDKETGTFKVIISGANAAAEIEKVEVPVWCQANQGDMKWYDAVKEGNNYVVNVDPMYHKYNAGLYKIHIYITAKNGVNACVGTREQIIETNFLYKIMGETTVTVEQMMRYFESNGGVYPTEILKLGGAATLEDFCRIFKEEAELEGVRAEVAFAQSMKETGWLRFGGIVQIGQFNFAGIGAEDGNPSGVCASFPNVKTGVRAQIQHLKAYASEDNLVNDLVDPRFNKVKRGSAIYVEWLGQQENPSGLGWATAEGYGCSIVNMIKKMKEK